MSKILTATFLYNGEKKVLKARLTDSQLELKDCKMNENVEFDSWSYLDNCYYSLYFFTDDEVDFEVIGLYNKNYTISKTKYDIKVWEKGENGYAEDSFDLPHSSIKSFTIK